MDPNYDGLPRPVWWKEIPSAPSGIIVEQGMRMMKVRMPYTDVPFSLQCEYGTTPAMLELPQGPGFKRRVRGYLAPRAT
jgi:hypothetical protein